MNWLDLKLGGRMLVKYPGLTIVGGLAMTFAIWSGVVIFQIVTLFVSPTLPLPAGDRIVEIRTFDVAESRREQRVLHDFLEWKSGLRSVTELGAWRDGSRNLVLAGGDARPVQVAEMTASGFRIASGTPLLGRVLGDDDERPGADPVAVIGYDVWRTRFGSDRDVIGRSIQFGHEHATVVGVMREGFEFPVSHDVWLPLQTALLDQAPRSGAAISVFGRLAPGETLKTAQAELDMFGRRAATDLPDTHTHLQPRVAKYVNMFAAETVAQTAVMSSIDFFVLLLLVLIFGNVGLLLFARAATRESDLLVRTALGASRRRIVGQMFAEALVLGSIAAVVGVTTAHVALRTWGMYFLELNVGRLPFWFDLGVSPETLLLAVALTVFGATIAGVLPALKITRRMGDRLKQTTSGAGGLRFSGVWTVVIVAQVAVTVAFPGLVYWEQFQLRKIQNFDPGFAAEQYLAVRVDRDSQVDQRVNADPVTLEAGRGLVATLDELRQRVAAQPGVAGVTFVERLPTTSHPQALIEMGYDSTSSSQAAVPAGANARAPLREATITAVDSSYFDVLEAPVLAGRAFSAADFARGANVAIVDQGFVDQVLQGRNPIGQQVRFGRNANDTTTEPKPWNQIVGVVKDLGMGAATQRGRAAGFYLPGTPDRFDEIHMLVHVRGSDPLTLGPRLRELAAAVDPSLRIAELQRASEINDGILWVVRLWLKMTVAMSSVALVLSLAGIYAVLSFAVTRRTREIGVRVTLGASRPRVIAAIFKRPLLQVGLGVLGGTSIILTVAALAKNTEFPGSETGLSWAVYAMLLGHGTAMLGICLLACIVPARRALGVQPTVALRME